MVFVLVIICVFLIIFFGFYLSSFNFLIGVFSPVFNLFYQSQMISKQNFALTESYVNYYNSNTGNNDYFCYDENNKYVDDDCLFRGLYGFTPPQEKIKLGIFNNIQGQIMVQITGAINTGIELQVRNINNNNTINAKILTGKKINSLLTFGNYEFQIKNNGTGRIQYFIYLSGNEGLKQIDNLEDKLIVKENYNMLVGQKKVLNSNIKYQVGMVISLGEIVNATGFESIDIKKISNIHFYNSGVDFGGLFVLKDFYYNFTGEKISVESYTGYKLCHKLLQGYYWNQMRDDILWPIDIYTLHDLQTTKNYFAGLSLSGGLFTDCATGNENSVYGNLTFWSISGTNQEEIFSLQAGREYDYTGNDINDLSNKFTQSLQIFDNDSYKIPIGLFIDSMYGIGFIGGKLDNASNMHKIVDTLNTMQANNIVKEINQKYVIFHNYLTGSASRFIKEVDNN